MESWNCAIKIDHLWNKLKAPITAWPHLDTFLAADDKDLFAYTDFERWKITEQSPREKGSILWERKLFSLKQVMPSWDYRVKETGLICDYD